MSYDHGADAIAPHGGVLVDRDADDETRRTRLAQSLGVLDLDARELSDLELLACGALSPLGGFMGRADYERVVAEGRLAHGLPWTLPITLPARGDLAPGRAVFLRAPDGRVAGVLDVHEIFRRDREREARLVYGTTDAAHPAVGALLADGRDHLVGGQITLLSRATPPFPRHHLEPRETRALFRARGWRRIVAFQTRNPIHRAHEFLTKSALEICDGLLVHPLVGATKDEDVPAAVRMACYTALLDGYYPRERVILSTFPAAMRYAGPREAIFHALVRKNYGCTHFIVGRDHAGVGNTYGTYDAQKIFDTYAPEELGIVPLRYEHSFFCRRCGGMATGKSCPHDRAHHVFLSGTRVRDLLRAGERPPEELMRPEVADLLIAAPRLTGA